MTNEQGSGPIEDWKEVLLQEALHGYAEAYVRDGLLELKDLSLDEAHDAVLELLQRDLEGSGDGEALGMRLTFETSLADEARLFDQTGKAEFAVMMYATWFEHWLNAMLLWKLGRRGLSDRDARDIVRNATVASKTGPVWKLIFDNDLPDDIAGTIRAVASRRNEFVHYKWAQAEDFAAGRGDHCARAEAAMTECLELEDHLVFGGRRDFLQQAMRLRRPQNG